VSRLALRFRVLASLTVFVVLSSLLEVGARRVGAEFPEWRMTDGAGVVMIGHPTRLWALAPGRKQNGAVWATISPLGLRGGLPADPKPPGRLRVLVLGDSTWFGHGVEDDETFPAQLEARLRADGLDVDVLNGGVPGYSTEQTRVELDELGWSLAPDLLLLGNLWSDNNVDSFRDEDLLATARAADRNPLYASHFFRLLTSAVDQARGGEGGRLVTWTRTSQWPETGGRRVSLKRYAENLDAMVRDAAARGVGAALLSPCNIETVKGRHRDGASWDVFFDAQRALAAHHGIPIVETLDAVRAAGAPESLFLDVMHPTAAGHAVFAATAATVLEAAGWPNTRLLATGGAFPLAPLVDNRFGVGDPNPSSPQRNLFGDATLPLPAGDPSLRGAGATGAGANPPSPPPIATSTPRSTQAAPKWTLSGSVVGGAGPYAVEVRAESGAVVASVRLGAAGPFSLNVRGDIDDVRVVVTDAGGKTGAATGSRGGGAADVLIR
jgi:lysophospholipase L1-like esterase